jgi:hypothetical protein
MARFAVSYRVASEGDHRSATLTVVGIVREVARRVGVSPGAPFRHFKSRTALLTAVARRLRSVCSKHATMKKPVTHWQPSLR